eukprot:sb/3477301/
MFGDSLHNHIDCYPLDALPWKSNSQFCDRYGHKYVNLSNSKPLCLFTKGIRVNAFGIHRAGKNIFVLFRVEIGKLNLSDTKILFLILICSLVALVLGHDVNRGIRVTRP